MSRINDDVIAIFCAPFVSNHQIVSNHFYLQPGLARFQAHNQPEYRRRKAAEELAKSRGVSIPAEKDAGEPDSKKTKRSTSVDPLERPSSASPLPDLPDDLKQKQVGISDVQSKNAVSANIKHSKYIH